MGDVVHLQTVCFPSPESLLWFMSGCGLLPGDSLCSSSNRPNEAQQLTSNGSNNLPMVLAVCTQCRVALVQPMLCLPRNLFYFFRDALLPSAQSVPDTGWTTITPCSFDNDASQVRVAGFRDASAPGSLAAGIFAGNSTAITHQ